MTAQPLDLYLVDRATERLKALQEGGRTVFAEVLGVLDAASLLNARRPDRV